MKMSLPQARDFMGVILYDGPSLIDGNRIIAVATGFNRSRNRKIGKNVIQTWILVADQSPNDALRSGNDESVCGSCKHRHFRSCYVNIAHGPAHVHKAWAAGKYHDLEDYSVFDEKFVRLGAYGDPAAVPVEIWQNIVEHCDGHTGYTHRWKQCDKELRHYCMASADTYEEAQDAMSRGWKPFYVRQEGEVVPDGFFVCPASEEAGKRLTCNECRACHGGEYNGKIGLPTLLAHGPSWKTIYFHRGMKQYKAKKAYVGIGWEWGDNSREAQRLRNKRN